MSLELHPSYRTVSCTPVTDQWLFIQQEIAVFSCSIWVSSVCLCVCQCLYNTVLQYYIFFFKYTFLKLNFSALLCSLSADPVHGEIQVGVCLSVLLFSCLPVCLSVCLSAWLACIPLPALLESKLGLWPFARMPLILPASKHCESVRVKLGNVPPRGLSSQISPSLSSSQQSQVWDKGYPVQLWLKFYITL